MERTDNAAFQQRSVSKDIIVTCATCKVTKRFLTRQGAKSFEMEHLGHEIVEDPLNNEVKQTREDKSATLEKLYVEMIPVDGNDVALIQVTGISPSGIAFVVNFPRERIKDVAKLLSEQSYIRSEGGVVERFVWGKEAVEISNEVANLLGSIPIQQEKKEIREEVVRVKQDVEKTAEKAEVQPMTQDIKDTITKVLDSYRWNTQPPYRVGVIMNDILSIETSTGIISRGLIEKIERLGYTFTAINIQEGTPVAWFRKGKLETSDLALLI
ncbi:MAG: hypothetical protein QXR69_00585 [Conexivisphaerales archaeon]